MDEIDCLYILIDIVFKFCEKNRILFIFFSHREYFPEKYKGKNPHGEGHNFPRGDLFSPQGFQNPCGDFDHYC